jgi:hypothetical protein
MTRSFLSAIWAVAIYSSLVVPKLIVEKVLELLGF